tara:strand:- start:109 stop:435 length:327 start_codon:yes stop_codon:yes gene_type:complete
MAINKVLIDGAQPAGTAAVDSYTSPTGGGGTRIISLTASLITGTANYRVFIGSSAIASNEIIPARSITGPNSSSPFELAGHFIGAGEKLFVQVSSGSTIAFRASGIEF